MQRNFRVAALALSLLASSVFASRFAVGTGLEYWSGVDLDASTNPARPATPGSAFGHLEFDVPMTAYYLEEPGFIFSLIGAMAQTEANELQAREDAIREGRGMYSYAYGKPAPIPEGRWFKWGFAHGEAEDIKAGGAAAGGMKIKVMRFDMNMVMAPRLIKGTDFFWMLGSDINGTSIKFNEAEDIGYFSCPLNLHLGWNPAWFAWLMLEARAGYDFVDPVGQLFFGFENYSQPYNIGLKANLGTDWISAYYSWGLRQEPVYNYDEYSRRYLGHWNLFGLRLDLGNLFGMLVAGRSGK